MKTPHTMFSTECFINTPRTVEKMTIIPSHPFRSTLWSQKRYNYHKSLLFSFPFVWSFSCICMVLGSSPLFMNEVWTSSSSLSVSSGSASSFLVHHVNRWSYRGVSSEISIWCLTSFDFKLFVVKLRSYEI